MNIHEKEPEDRIEQEFELFVHPEGSATKVVKAGKGTLLKELLEAIGFQTEGVFVLVNDPPMELYSEEEIEIQVEAVDLGTSLGELGLKEHSHISCHTCKVITVAVFYNGEEVKKKFPPSALISFITRWAKKRLKLDDASAEKLVLQIAGTNERPRPDVRLGQLGTIQGCKIVFNLVAAELIQG